MSLNSVPEFILNRYEVHEWRHAIAILQHDFPNEWKDVVDLLTKFKLCKSWVATAGGNKSKISDAIDSFLYQRGWSEWNLIYVQ